MYCCIAVVSTKRRFRQRCFHKCFPSTSNFSWGNEWHSQRTDNTCRQVASTCKATCVSVHCIVIANPLPNLIFFVLPNFRLLMKFLWNSPSGESNIIQKLGCAWEQQMKQILFFFMQQLQTITLKAFLITFFEFVNIVGHSTKYRVIVLRCRFQQENLSFPKENLFSEINALFTLQKYFFFWNVCEVLFVIVNHKENWVYFSKVFWGF